MSLRAERDRVATRDDLFDDADLEHEWAKRWRIPLVADPYPRWRYEVALAVPRGERRAEVYALVWPDEAEAEVIGSLVDYRRGYYDPWYGRMLLELALDVDSSTNTVILAKSEAGWKYRRSTHRDGLWPNWTNQKMCAKFPPSKAGLIALIDHAHGVDDDHPLPFRDLVMWKADHPEVWS